MDSRKSYDGAMAATRSRACTLASVIPLLCSLTTGVCQASAFQLQQRSMMFDPSTGFQEDMHPWSSQSPFSLESITSPSAFKAEASKDPDLPSTREALTGPHAEEFWKSMDKEIASLMKMDTWEIVP